jgi:GxxExxY protein
MNPDKNIQEVGAAPIIPHLLQEEEFTGKIFDAAYAVHNSLGASFLENVYANALAIELRSKGVACVQEPPFKVIHKGVVVGDYVADLVVEGRVIVELKACVVLDQIHEAQLINYLRASRIKVGLLLNFGRPKLQYRRLVC